MSRKRGTVCQSVHWFMSRAGCSLLSWGGSGLSSPLPSPGPCWGHRPSTGWSTASPAPWRSSAAWLPPPPRAPALPADSGGSRPDSAPRTRIWCVSESRLWWPTRPPPSSPAPSCPPGARPGQTNMGCYCLVGKIIGLASGCDGLVWWSTRIISQRKGT